MGADAGSDAAAETAAVTAPLSADVAFLLARANAVSLAAGNAAVTPFGLKVRSYSVLALIVTGSRPSQRELAAYLRLDPSRVVSLVDELERAGLVRRDPDPADRRANVVVPTDQGRAVYAQAEAAAHAAERAVLARLTDAQRAQLAELLSAVAFPTA
ncbi:MarR family winged helix-turn-helix transcriptional regulator [Microbacterium sp.]|uniref:MarR family winged helix-turn-helix transcriptional regulator n=1 Tax=Microbacterium sp. TaxID=51671 RepID=UPI003A83F50A